MGQYVNPRNDSFASAVLYSQIYVDKIRDIYHEIVEKDASSLPLILADIKNLCNRYNMDFDETKRWYDGYGFKGLKHIYCPNSVANAMLDGEYNNYWTNTVAYESLKYYITIDKSGLKDAIIHLLAIEHYKVNVETFENDMTKISNKNDILTILIHLGYLGYDSENEEAYIPNEEVRRAFGREISYWLV